MRETRLKLYASELRRTLILAFPIIASQLGQILLQVTDSIMIGKVGTVPLAASAFAGSLFSVLLVIGMAFLTFISTLIAQAFGANRSNECAEILRHGCVLGIVLGLLMGVTVQVGSHFLGFFGQPADVVMESKSFFIILGWSAIPVFVFQVFRQFSEGLAHAVPPTLITLIGILVNIFLNWIYIYGHLGSPALGLYGAGLSTFFARTIMMVLMVGYIIIRSRFQAFRPLHWFGKLNHALLKRALMLGVPSGFQALFEVGAFAAAAVLMGMMGTTALAAHQIAINVATITFMVILGLSFAANIRVGQAVGRNDIPSARRIGIGCIAFSGVLMFCFGLLFLIARNILPQFYIADPLVITTAAELIAIAALFQIFDGIQGVSIGALRGLSDVAVPTAMNFVAYWVIGLPIGYYLAFVRHKGAAGVWLGLALGLAVAATLLSLRFYIFTNRSTGAAKKNLSREENGASLSDRKILP